MLLFDFMQDVVIWLRDAVDLTVVLSLNLPPKDQPHYSTTEGLISYKDRKNCGQLSMLSKWKYSTKF